MPDGTNHHGWLHGLSYAEIAQRASLEEILESSDKLMMLAVQHNEPVNQIRALIERQLHNLPAPTPKMTTVQPPRDRASSSSRDGGGGGSGGRDKDGKGAVFVARMPPPGPRRRRGRWGFAESDGSDDDGAEDDDDADGDGGREGGGGARVVEGAAKRVGSVAGVKRAAEGDPDDDEGDGQ